MWDKDPKNLGDVTDVKERNKEVRLAAKERADMLRAIMGLKQGREFMAELLGRCHVNASSMSSDALQMAFTEGERNIGLSIQADLSHPSLADLYILMLKEIGEKVDARPE